jgi:hypothetical protein
MEIAAADQKIGLRPNGMMLLSVEVASITPAPLAGLPSPLMEWAGEDG